MMKSSDSNEYYTARVEAERQAAVVATCPQARRAHEELALAYEQLIDGALQSNVAAIRSSNIR
jgi:hypothetical protein